MTETDKMDAMEFGRWLGMGTAYDPIIASRDAYRERQALAAAADRASHLFDGKWVPGRPAIIEAILGAPRFKVGQLVRAKVKPSYIWSWPPEGNQNNPGQYEPVTVRIDEAGRAIVQEE